jgi:solute carrier family 13 (sodium-dependent dicarboxylate transporter), member 2/3/5
MLRTLARSWTNYVGLVTGPALFLIFFLTDPISPDLSRNAWLVFGLVAWMATWWITEPVPIPATSLLPIFMFPLLGIDNITAAAAPYANPLIYLFFGGFILSIAMEKCNLHKRIALLTLLIVSRKPSHQVGGLMIICAFLSMWMSNTATAVMMLPIAMSIITLKREQYSKSGFGQALLLGIAYSASIGGLATLIGSPPNALLAGYLQNNYGITLGFSEWMMAGLPLSIIMLILTWFLLTKIFFNLDADGEIMNIRKQFRSELEALGPVSRAERIVIAVFIMAAVGWIFRPLINNWLGLDLNDTMIALFAATLLFIVPKRVSNYTHVLDWDDTKNLPWGVLLLFGGGLSLAAQIEKSGAAEFVANQVAVLSGVNTIVLILLVISVIVFLTEVTSNTATAAGFIPLLGPVAISLGVGLAPLLIPAVMATSFAFMMPVATPPNAIVFASGELKISDMMRCGFWLNLLSIGLITIFAITLVPLLFNF